MTDVTLDLTPVQDCVAREDYATALIHLDKWLAQFPDQGRLWSMRADLALRMNQPQEARRFALYALALQEGSRALDLLATAYTRCGEWEAAYEVAVRWARLDTRNVNTALRVGNAAYEAGWLDEAVQWFREAVRRDPEAVDAWNNLGFTLKSQGQFTEALVAYEEGIRRFPDNADLRWNRALCLLTVGRYEEGLQETEWRWRKASFPSKPRNFPQPLWMGKRVGTLLIHAEQGFGDCLQMLRYVPLAAARVERVIVEIQAELFRLVSFQQTGNGFLPANIEFVIQGRQSLPSFDAHVPMMTLPLALGCCDYAYPPFARKYLRCPLGVTLTDAAQPDRLFNVGLVWRGRPTFPHDHLRSFTLADLMPLFSMPHVRWFSLQKIPGTETRHELEQLPVTVIDLGEQAQDFYDTATYLKAMDLVITVDTSVAHLSGALGIETWVTLIRIPDWRWGLEGDKTGWYDSVRLFRQTRPREWSDVFETMRVALAYKVNQFIQDRTA